jgi:histidinol-phosphate aminotransferase
MPSPALALSRRSFARALGIGAAGALLRPVLVPSLAETAPAATAQPDARRPVRLSANENPYGAPPAVAAALAGAVGRVALYPDEEADALQAEIARLHGVTAEQVVLGNGSSQVLRLAAAAAAGSGRLVMAEPTFEALARYARAEGAEVVTVPLTAVTLRHDLPAMRAALGAHRAGRATESAPRLSRHGAKAFALGAHRAGRATESAPRLIRHGAKAFAPLAGAALVYLCNPNNPTGTATPPEAVAAFVAAVPRGVLVLVDEAYHHYAEGSPGYASALPLVASHPHLVVARTFSKIYGLAGLRCGYAVGQPEAIARLRAQQPWDSLNLMALVAARAALADAGHVAGCRRRNAEVRAWAARELAAAGYEVVPSTTNFFMADLRRDVGPVIAALRAQGVEVGRRFAALPNHLRVTVGTAEEMEVFVAALRRVAA